MAGIGHNSNVISLDERRAWFQAELTKYASTERQKAEALTCEQLAALNGIGRLQAQRQSLLDNIAHFYSINKRADPAPGVLLLITLYSDNNDGCSSLSVSRMADFLSREPRRISQAISRLVTDKMVLVAKYGSGTDTSKHYPWVHHSFGTVPDALTWILDVRAPVRPRGRPKATLAENPGRPTGGVLSKTHDGPKEGFYEKPMTINAKTHDGGRHPILLIDTTNDSDRETQGSFELEVVSTNADKPEIVEPCTTYIPSEVDCASFHSVVTSWCSKQSSASGSLAMARADSDACLRGLVRSLGAVPPALAARALSTMLVRMGGKSADVQAERRGGRSGLGPLMNYASKVLRSAYDEVVKSEMDVRVTAEIQKRRVGAYDRAVEENAQRRAKHPRMGRVSMTAVADEVFE